MAMESHLVGQLQDQAAGEEEEIEDFDVIDKLQAFGIGAADIKKAKEGGCHTCQSLIMSTMKRLTAIKGLSEAKIEKMREAAKKVCSVGQWQTGAMVMQMRERDVVKITTGAAAIDELLGGGIETKSITEVYGEHRCGKTQLCLTMCVTTQLGEDMKGGAGKVAYIDTDGTFRPERIVPIADRFGLDAQAVLNNIFYARAFTHEHQMELVYSIAAKMVEEPFKLLIIDSIMAAFRVDFSGRGELADRQQKLGQMLNHLKKIAEEYNVAVVLTNQVMSDPGAGAMFVADPKKPLGGHVMAHAVTTRLSLRKGKAEQRLMKVVGSPYLAEAEASFAIGADGLNDYKD